MQKIGLIDANLHNRLTPPRNINTQRMYFLPKVRKTRLRLEPIISATNGPTEKASEYIDRLLQPHMTQIKSYIKNSTDLIQTLRTLVIPPHCLLVTLDVESLYTNISHDEAIISFLRIVKDHPLKVFLLDLLKYVLKNNVFQFDNLIFTQLCGIAMGTKLAPALATIYLGQLEEKFLNQQTLKPLLWKRYIDDILMLWPYSREELQTFLTKLNRVHKNIKFSAEIFSQSCNFLDITIYKSPTFLRTGILSTKIYSTTNLLIRSHSP